MAKKDKKWKLRGKAYGRTYDETMSFIKKEVISKQERAVFRTNKGNEVIVSPRYEGSHIGSNDNDRGDTICAFLYNGEHVALADYNEQKQEVIVMEY